MSKVKYYYDPDTLSYHKIKVKKRDKFKTFLFGILGVLVLMFAGYVGFSQIFESPKEKALNRELVNLKLNYGLLSKKMNQVEDVLTQVQQRDNAIYRTYFEANPIPTEQRTAGFGGINRYESLEGFENSAMIIDATKKLDILSKQLYVQTKSLDEIVKLAKDKDRFLQSIPSIQPIKKEDLLRMASGYGWRTDPFTKARKRHKGMDFSAIVGTPVYATGNGIVKRADRRLSGYGKHIEINHGFGYVTLYAHLDKYRVRRGQRVKRGDVIGYVGMTGRTAGHHLHYEVHKNGVAINPINFYYGNLTPEEFLEMQRIASQEGQSED
ncbi:MAG: M23 family metallopeptidase [Flavobacteriaceae bacterium]